MNTETSIADEGESATASIPEMARSDHRRHLSDLKAYQYLGKFEMRRVRTTGNFGIYLRGTDVQVGTVYQRAEHFVRALKNTLEASAFPARDRFRQKHEGPKRKYTKRVV